MAGKGGGAWKVAYADFVTAMMAFFMVMWITAQNQQVKESIARHFSDPFGARDKNGKSGGTDTSGPPFSIKENSRFSFKPKIKVEMYDGKEYQVGTTVYFSGNSTELSDAAEVALIPLTYELKWNTTQIDVVGYASPGKRAEGGVDPWQVAYNRCLAIKELFVTRGVPANKIKMSQAIANLNPDPDDETEEAVDESEPADRVEVRVRKRDK